jgi:hypothetical protein
MIKLIFIAQFAVLVGLIAGDFLNELLGSTHKLMDRYHK